MDNTHEGAPRRRGRTRKAKAAGREQRFLDRAFREAQRELPAGNTPLIVREIVDDRLHDAHSWLVAQSVGELWIC